jgi:hypothetical protein
MVVGKLPPHERSRYMPGSELTTEDASVLSGLSGIVATVEKLLAAGVSAAQMAEKVASFVDPSLASGLTAFIGILQEAEVLVNKA